MDRLSDELYTCRLCLGSKSTAIYIFQQADIDIAAILNKHIGEVNKRQIIQFYLGIFYVTEV